MNTIFRNFAAVCALILMPLQGVAKEVVTVFAAASLKDALDDAIAEWPYPVVVSYGGSGLLARQVAQGAPADLVILANSAWMDWLADQGWPDLRVRSDLISNRLVLIAPVGTPPIDTVDAPTMRAHLGNGRVAIGQTQGVPAGIYGRQWLSAAGLWDDLQLYLAETENVRAALALVARGEVPLGVVYRSDAMADPGVDVVYAVPPEAHDPIVYPMAVIDDNNAAEATEFAAFLRSEVGQSLFLRHGFAQVEDAQ